MASPLHQALARAADRVLDPTVAFSFDRTGYRRHAVGFDLADLDVDLSGRVVLVTGANGGLGKEAARQLARLRAEVWMLCRSTARGEAARAELAADTGGDLRLAQVDLSDLASVDAALDRLPPRVDVLVHNAGVLLDQRSLTPQGLETTLATHLVGPLRLTAALLPRMQRAADADPARLVWVSSGGMYTRRLSVERLGRVQGRFDGVTTYADVKRAQVALSALLAPRLRPLAISSYAMHPGWADTAGVRSSIPRFHALTRGILRTPAEGADTIAWLAACPRVGGDTGRFWFDRRAVSPYLVPGTREGEAERAALWEAACAWAGIRWSGALPEVGPIPG